MLELRAQLVLLNLAARAHRQGIDEDHVVRQPPAGDFSFEKLQQFLARELVPGAPATRSLSRRNT